MPQEEGPSCILSGCLGRRRRGRTLHARSYHGPGRCGGPGRLLPARPGGHRGPRLVRGVPRCGLQGPCRLGAVGVHRALRPLPALPGASRVEGARGGAPHAGDARRGGLLPAHRLLGRAWLQARLGRRAAGRAPEGEAVGGGVPVAGEEVCRGVVPQGGRRLRGDERRPGLPRHGHALRARGGRAAAGGGSRGPWAFLRGRPGGGGRAVGGAAAGRPPRGGAAALPLRAVPRALLDGAQGGLGLRGQAGCGARAQEARGARGRGLGRAARGVLREGAGADGGLLRAGRRAPGPLRRRRGRLVRPRAAAGDASRPRARPLQAGPLPRHAGGLPGVPGGADAGVGPPPGASGQGRRPRPHGRAAGRQGDGAEARARPPARLLRAPQRGRHRGPRRLHGHRRVDQRPHSRPHEGARDVLVEGGRRGHVRPEVRGVHGPGARGPRQGGVAHRAGEGRPPARRHERGEGALVQRKRMGGPPQLAAARQAAQRRGPLEGVVGCSRRRMPRPAPSKGRLRGPLGAPLRIHVTHTCAKPSCKSSR